MSHAQNTTTSNVQVSRQDGTTLTSTTVNASVVEDLPQEARGVRVTVDFGTDSDMATTTVVSCPWVTAASRLVAAFFGSTADHDPEDVLLDGLTVICDNIVAGVGFDVIASAPENAYGLFNVHVIGV